MPELLGGRMGPSMGRMAQLTVQQEAYSIENTRNAHFGQLREREMHRGLCG